MKHEHYGDYTAQDTLRSESALLTVWAVLREFREDLVLVGGLVPRYLCKSHAGEMQAVTMDVDLGVSLGLSSGQYETTTTRLTKAGFVWREKRFVKQVEGMSLFIDFLTDKPTPGANDSVMVDDIPVSAQPGVQRALECCREVSICGRDLYGARVTEVVRVSEVGPYICLKLLAYHNRAQSKDVFDVVRCVRDYDGGAQEAARLFHLETSINPAHATALCVLGERFTSMESKGPVQYADFCLGGGPTPTPTPTSEPTGTDAAFLRAQRANEALDVAALLLGK